MLDTSIHTRTHTHTHTHYTYRPHQHSSLLGPLSGTDVTRRFGFSAARQSLFSAGMDVSNSNLKDVRNSNLNIFISVSSEYMTLVIIFLLCHSN